MYLTYFRETKAKTFTSKSISLLQQLNTVHVIAYPYWIKHKIYGNKKEIDKNCFVGVCVCSLTDTRVSVFYESIINVKNMYNQSYPLFLTFSSDTYIVLCCCCVVLSKQDFVRIVLHTNVLWCASCHYIRFHASWYLWHVFLFFLLCSFTTLTTTYWRRKNKQQQQKNEQMILNFPPIVMKKGSQLHDTISEYQCFDGELCETNCNHFNYGKSPFGCGVSVVVTCSLVYKGIIISWSLIFMLSSTFFLEEEEKKHTHLRLIPLNRVNKF